MVVEATASEGWASATFSGHRHRLELSFTGGDAARVDALVRELATAELVMPSPIVADISLIEHEMRDACPHPTHRLVFEALTVAVSNVPARAGTPPDIDSASGRERGCQYVWLPVARGS